MSEFLSKTKRKRKLYLLILLVILTLVLFSIYRIIQSNNASSTNNPISIKGLGSKTAKDINREFSFSLKDQFGKEVSRLTYRIVTAEIQKEIYVKEKKARAVEGRAFLIFNIKISNPYEQNVTINSRDYVRVSVSNINEWHAPDIHNDPIEVLAISTKDSRVGFVVNDGYKDFKLQVGEINGKKEIISLSFR